MFYLTRQERLLVVFLAGTLAVGAAVRAVRGRPAPRPRPPFQMEVDLSRPKAPVVATGDAAVTAGRATPDLALNVNTASAEELCRLPGIGPSLAERIINYRERHGPFKKPSDLKRVKGIGAAKLRQLEPFIRCGEAEPKNPRAHKTPPRPPAP